MSQFKRLNFWLPRNLHSNRYFAESHVTQKTQGQTLVWGQKGRLHAENVKFVPHKKEKIIEAVQHAVYNKEYREEVGHCSNPYGDGKSSKKIAEILANLTIDDKLIIKDITY